MGKRKKTGIVSIFSQNLYNKRILKNLTQKELEAIAGVDGGMISKMERGEVNTTLESLEKIARGLGINYLELLIERPQNT